MAEQHEEDGLFKSPKQLIVVVLLAFIVPVTIAVMFAQLATSGRKSSGGSEEAVAARIQPVAKVEVAGAGTGVQAAKSAEEIYKSTCAACHDSGAAGAPKLGDKGAWGPRIGVGLDKLAQSAIQGKGAMPPKGGNATLSDNDIARVVAFMANKSGASFKEPAAPQAEARSAAPVPQAATAAAPQAAAAAPQPAAPAAGTGKSVYDTHCAACHGTGAAGAPKLGDKAAWAPRLGAGVDGLAASAIKGKGAMPPKGGNASLADADVKAAVEYMMSQAK
jgi:cytochrome c5